MAENNISKVKLSILKKQRRQREIIWMLYYKEQLSVKELMKEFGVGKRTIQKDIKELREGCHGEIIVKVEKGVYKLIEKEKLEGIKQIEEYTNQNIVNGFFQALIEDETKKEDSIDNPLILKPHCKKLKKQTFLRIFRIIGEKFPCEFSYKTRESKIKKFTIYPYKVVLINNYWYFVGKDLEDEKIKYFRIDRIKSPFYDTTLPKEDKEEREKSLRKIFEIESPWYEEENRQTVKLKVKGEAKEYLQNNLPPNTELEKETKDYLIINYTYYHPDEALSLIKKWLPDITILNNNALKEKLEKMLIKYLEETKEV